jgi:hypothetical protein
MGLVATVAASLVLWVVLWALGIKAFDGFWIVVGILIFAVVGRMVTRYLPGRDAT